LRKKLIGIFGCHDLGGGLGRRKSWEKKTLVLRQVQDQDRGI
jgi:hypothetical protein